MASEANGLSTLQGDSGSIQATVGWRPRTGRDFVLHASAHLNEVSEARYQPFHPFEEFPKKTRAVLLKETAA